MVKLFRRNYRTLWSAFVGVLVVIVFSSILIFSFVELLGSAIWLVADPSIMPPMADSSVPVSIFGATLGILLLFAVIVMTSSVSLNIARRNQDLTKLRLLGMTYRQIRSLIFQELIVIIFFSLLLGYAFGNLTAKGILEYFASNNIISKQFTIYKYFAWPLGAMALVIFFVLLAGQLAVRSTKRIKLTFAGGAPLKISLKKRIFEIGMGLFFVGGAISLTVIKPLITSEGMTLGMPVMADFIFLGATIYLGPHVLQGAAYLGFSMTKKFPIINNAFQSITRNARHMKGYMVMLTGFFSFAMYSLDSSAIYSLGEETNSSGIQTANFLVFLIGIYALIAASNALITFGIFQKKTFLKLRFVGFFQKDILKSLTVSASFITFIGLFFGAVIVVINNIDVTHFNNLKLQYTSSPLFFWIFLVIPPLILALITLIPYLASKDLLVSYGTNRSGRNRTIKE